MASIQKYWFWAEVITIMLPKERLRNRSARGDVLSDLIIVEAASPKQALQKAERFGKLRGGDSDGTLTVGGKPATRLFLGIESMGLIHEPFEDGSEITYSEQRASLDKAMKWTTPKATLLKELVEEFRPKLLPGPRRKHPSTAKGTKRLQK